MRAEFYRGEGGHYSIFSLSSNLSLPQAIFPFVSVAFRCIRAIKTLRRKQARDGVIRSAKRSARGGTSRKSRPNEPGELYPDYFHLT